MFQDGSFDLCILLAFQSVGEKKEKGSASLRVLFRAAHKNYLCTIGQNLVTLAYCVGEGEIQPLLQDILYEVS